MGFSNIQPRQYFKIKDGNVVITINASDEANFQKLIRNARAIERYNNKTTGIAKIDIKFNDFEGRLRKIEAKDSTFNNQKVKNWELYFEDGEKLYVCTMMYNGFQIQGLINALSSIDGDIGLIKLRPYKFNDKTGITLYHKGEKLNWKYSKDEQPPLEIKKTLGDDGVTIVDDIDDKTGKPRINDKKRMMWLLELVMAINEKIGADKFVVGSSSAEVEHDDIDDSQPF